MVTTRVKTAWKKLGELLPVLTSLTDIQRLNSSIHADQLANAILQPSCFFSLMTSTHISLNV